MIRTHKDLKVYQLSRELVKLIYMNTSGFPTDETYGLRQQIRRSAVSIPSNIAEGSARKGNKELSHFLYIALGSLVELDTQIEIAIDLDYMQKSSIIDEKLIVTRKMLLNLIKAVK